METLPPGHLCSQERDSSPPLTPCSPGRSGLNLPPEPAARLGVRGRQRPARLPPRLPPASGRRATPGRRPGVPASQPFPGRGSTQERRGTVCSLRRPASRPEQVSPGPPGTVSESGRRLRGNRLTPARKARRGGREHRLPWGPLGPEQRHGRSSAARPKVGVCSRAPALTLSCESPGVRRCHPVSSETHGGRTGTLVPDRLRARSDPL